METKIVTNPKELFDYSIAYQAMNPHHPIQVETIDPSINEEFMDYCHNLCEIEKVEELSGWARKPSSLKFEDVISKAPTAIKCGMKINHFPQWKIDDWEKWENGYIQVYIRMDSDVKGNEWFVWQYIRMNHLDTILNQFVDRLEYFYIPMVVIGSSRI